MLEHDVDSAPYAALKHYPTNALSRHLTNGTKMTTLKELLPFIVINVPNYDLQGFPSQKHSYYFDVPQLGAKRFDIKNIVKAR